MMFRTFLITLGLCCLLATCFGQDNASNADNSTAAPDASTAATAKEQAGAEKETTPSKPLPALNVLAFELDKFTEFDNGTYTGFLPDLIEALSLKRFTYTFKNMSDVESMGNAKSGAIQKVAEGVVDFAAAPFRPDLDREQVVDFTEPYRTLKMVLLASSGYNSEAKTLKQVLEDSSAKLAVVKGSSQEKFFHTGTGLEEVKTVAKRIKNDKQNIATLKAGIAKVRTGDILLFIDDLWGGILANTKPCDIRVIDTDLFKRRLAFAAKQETGKYGDYNTVRDLLNDAIIKVKHEGTIEKLEKQYFGSYDQCSSAITLTISSLVFVTAMLTSIL